MSRRTQRTSLKQVCFSKASALPKSTVSYPCCCSSRSIARSTPGLSSTTKTRFRFDNKADLTLSCFRGNKRTRGVSVQSQQGPVNLEGPKVPGTDTCRAGFGSVQTAGCAATAPPPDERQPERALLQRFRQNVLFPEQAKKHAPPPSRSSAAAPGCR